MKFASQNLRNASQIAKCEPLIHTLNPPIAILQLANCLSHEWPTFLKRCYWLLRQEYKRYSTRRRRSSFLHKPEQKHR